MTERDYLALSGVHTQLELLDIQFTKLDLLLSMGKFSTDLSAKQYDVNLKKNRQRFKNGILALSKIK